MLKFLTDLFKPEASKPPPITSEASMNFDARSVGPFLTRLANNPRFGLPADFTASVVGAIQDMALNETRRWRIDGAFDGSRVQIEIEVFIDEAEAPDLAFFSTGAAIDEIGKELAAFAEASET
ncbi:hypothetical protein K3555_02500 [Leisingera sp. M527]|uniref:hypothetical protein n=1 Tax=Leisingera sp. M527 TaxID=2867014 RepID=UPI0021A5FF2A|nr:hypothetical protein [Leisingera sp. M527]UWQ33410.1 hypothetical protein K3555_02500 [Leisingera sp. M527]